MDIKIIASTHMGYVAKKDEFDFLSGKCAGICYMPGTLNDLMAEEDAKTYKRVSQTKVSGHHSVYDHESITMYLQDIPKILAMVINNEHQYTASEKSARFTKMKLGNNEQLLFNKWMDIFKTRIVKKYKADYSTFFTDNRIEKLAQENARYLISVFTPTSMVYTTTYRQINYIIAFMKNFVSKNNKTDFEQKLSNCMLDFMEKVKAQGYYDEQLSGNEKFREFSLFAGNKNVEEYFGDVYATTYKASFAELAQAQRHRTLSYNMIMLDGEYYVPPIIRDNSDMVDLWISDIKSLGNIYPQATMLEINEFGTLDNFILKIKERKCTFAQLEINQVTIFTQNKYVHALQLKNHPRTEELMAYTKGSRCTFPDFKCTNPCEFPLGVNETREI